MSRACRTVSHEAALVIGCLIPLHLQADERGRRADGEEKDAAKERTLGKWRKEWEATETGAWTRRVIPDPGRWAGRKHGEQSYRMAQALSGHGCFGDFLCRIGKRESAACGRPDSAEHTLLECDRWEARRR